MQIIQQIQINADSLKGRVIVADIAIESLNNKVFQHRVFAAYAPWDPGADNLSKNFWTDLEILIKGSPHPWTLAGDLNVTIDSTERASGGAERRRIFRDFLTSTKATDLWSLNVDRNRMEDWTCRSKRDDADGGSIIDRVVVSSDSVVEAEIMTLGNGHWIPTTDHRPILVRCILKSPHGIKSISRSQPILFSKPRIRFPLCTEKSRHYTFRQAMDIEMERQGVNAVMVTDDASFTKLYEALPVGTIMKTESQKAYGRMTRTKGKENRRITSPEIQSQVGYIRALGGAIQIARNDHFNASFAAMATYNKICRKARREEISVDSALKIERRTAWKRLYCLKSKEARQQAVARDKGRIITALNSGSTKQMVSSKQFVPLPLIVKNPKDEELVSNLTLIKQITRDYWSDLYKRRPPPIFLKPWLKTESVMKINVRHPLEPHLI